MLNPVASRPQVPAAYGIAPPDGGRGLLPWSWADERLRGKYIWWLASTRPNGAPHLMPIWAVWLGDGVAFSTDAASRKAQNVAHQPRVSIVPERGSESVIVEGVVEALPEARRREFFDTYLDVWATDVEEMDSPVLFVRPTRVFGFVDEADGYPLTATRWEFA